MINRCLIQLALAALAGSPAFAQAIPRTQVAEHFTNTYCSICASRNPGFYQNLVQHPAVLHIAYYPSLPYVLCPLSLYDPPPQDSRANYYNVFGETPRIVVQGVAVNPGMNYGDSAIFNLGDDTLSSFQLRVSITATDATTGLARVVVRKVDASTADSLGLYAVLTQDTLLFAANNGEQMHCNVFRRALWGNLPVKVAMPENIGDSAVFAQTFQIDPSWPLSRISATAVLHRATDAVEQAARSARIDTSLISSSAKGVEKRAGFRVFPNPVANELLIESTSAATLVGAVLDVGGRLIRRVAIPQGNSRIDVADIPPGNYLLSIVAAGGASEYFKFTRK